MSTAKCCSHINKLQNLMRSSKQIFNKVGAETFCVSQIFNCVTIPKKNFLGNLKAERVKNYHDLEFRILKIMNGKKFLLNFLTSGHKSE